MAMSGGVDSSLVAAMLAAEGHEVIGVFLRFPRFNRHADDSEDSAAGVASALGIPFHAIDCRRPFEKNVMEGFCAAYLNGLTPNPCVDCNRLIKFGFLMDKAMEFGARRLATGHYARVERDRETGRHILKKGADADKDQSYFLYSLSQNQLARAVFPIGQMKKRETRSRARKFGLAQHDRPASRDICFLVGQDYRSFLAERFPGSLQDGPIVDACGKELGVHKGIAFYTVGQRRGLGIGGGKPLYVLAVDVRARTLMVGSHRELLRSRMIVKKVNWIPFDSPPSPITLGVKIRFRQPESLARVTCLQDGRAEIVFEKPQAAVAPGQSAVFYHGDIVVGGGVIE